MNIHIEIYIRESFESLQKRIFKKVFFNDQTFFYKIIIQDHICTSRNAFQYVQDNFEIEDVARQ